MPFQIGGIAIHNDLQHTGSAKRDTASGVAGLDVGGDIIAPGNELELTRDASGDILIIEHTSEETAVVFRRTGANAYTLYNNTVAGGKIIQDSSMKDVASGIAGLNAGAKVPVANLESPVGTHAALAASHGRTNIDGVTERDAALAAHAGANVSASVHPNAGIRFSAVDTTDITRNTIYQNTLAYPIWVSVFVRCGGNFASYYYLKW